MLFSSLLVTRVGGGEFILRQGALEDISKQTRLNLKLAGGEGQPHFQSQHLCECKQQTQICQYNVHYDPYTSPTSFRHLLPVLVLRFLNDSTLMWVNFTHALGRRVLLAWKLLFGSGDVAWIISSKASFSISSVLILGNCY